MTEQPSHTYIRGNSLSFPGGTSGKYTPANAGATRDVIPGWGRSPGGGHGTYSSFLAWRIPWPEEPGRLQPIGLQRIRHD